MSLLDPWLNFRDRCLRSRRFHKLATQFPLTRLIARKRQSELFDLVAGFVYSQILLTCVELDVLTKVGQGASIEALAPKIGLPVDETRRLVEGAAALRLLQRHGALYRLGDLGAVLIANPGINAMIRHHPALYLDLADMPAFLRKGRGESNLSNYWSYARNPDPAKSGDAKIAAYSELMSESQTMVADEVLASVKFSQHKVLLDVGGGQGAFLSAVAGHAPHLQLKLFDLPAVADRAAARFQDEGLADRVETIGGSFFEDKLPTGADMISLVRIIHDHDDDPAQAILNSVYEALERDGELIVCEPMSTGGYAQRMSDAYFNFYLHAMGSGRPRPPSMLKAMLEKAGFQDVRLLKTRSPLITSVISARK